MKLFVANEFLLFVASLLLVSGLLQADAQTYSYGHHPPGVGHRPPRVFPPAPPPLPKPNVGKIRNIADVCKVCSSYNYSANCYSKSSSSCLRAMYIYRADVLKVKDNICDCYNDISQQLLQYCPNLNSQVAYLGNCDFTTGRKGRGEASAPLLCCTPAAEVEEAEPQSTPPRNIFGVTVMNMMISAGKQTKLCYEFDMGAGVEPPTSAHIYNATKGLTPRGPPLITLFTRNKGRGTNIKSCIRVPLPLIRAISSDKTYLYHVQVNTAKYPQGALRAQLGGSPYLFAIVKQVTKGNYFGIVQLQFRPYSVKYFFDTRGSTLPKLARMYQTIGKKSELLFNIYGSVGGPKPAAINSLTPGLPAIKRTLTNPSSSKFIAQYTEKTYFPVIGTFSDTVNVKSILTAAQEPDVPKGVKGRALFFATIGGGAVCYRFVFDAGVGTVTEAHIHTGAEGKRGPISVFLFGQNILPRSSRELCIPVDVDLTATIASYAQGSYVQVYTLQNPMGAVRGQLEYNI
eukprot:jgi/Mesen1/1882/ME000143S00933